MNNKKTLYYDKSIEELNLINKLNKKPTLGIHVCCGPCFTFPLEFLNPFFKIYVLYSNSNIYPKEEFDRRLNELKKYIDYFNNEYQSDVELVIFNYDNINYMKDLEKYSDEKEGSNRCFLCYEKRMDFCYKYADEHNFDYFTTVMTISRQKNSYKINEIGERLSKKYKTKYFYSDFKKKKGIDKAIELRKKYNMYNQLYCGCVYSYLDYMNKQKD